MTAQELIKQLELQAHPEGGFYKETYRSQHELPQTSLPEKFSGDRAVSTAIYFLIEEGDFSALHKIKSDELWHFYAGDALEVIEIDAEGNLKTTHVGNKPEKGQVFQYTVKADTWFGSRVLSGGTFSLVGCTVAPGFDFRDFEMAERSSLIKQFPQHKTLIEELTRF